MKDEVPKTFPPALRACWIKLNSVFAKKLQNLGLTPDQYSVLRWVHEIKDKPICQKDLASLLFTDPNNIAELVKRMEKNNLIKHTSPANDKRKKIIFTTKLGKKKWLHANNIAFSLEQKAFSSLSRDEIEHLTYLLKAISEYLNKDA